MSDYNSTRSGNQYHGTDYASRMGQFDRQEAEARDRAQVAARAAASQPSTTFTPVTFSSGGSTGTTYSSGSSSGKTHARRTNTSAAPLWIFAGCCAVWYGTAVAVASLLVWMGVSIDLASKIGFWTLPVLVGGVIAAFVGWALWHISVQIAKGLAATWRALVATYHWSIRHRKPLGVTALYALCVTGVYSLMNAIAPPASVHFDLEHAQRAGVSALTVIAAAVAALLWMWIARKTRARRERVRLAREHVRQRIEPTYTWNVSKR